MDSNRSKIEPENKITDTLDRSDKIFDLAQTVTNQYFVMMLNPKYRGPNFDFNTFNIEDFILGAASLSFEKPLSEPENQRLQSLARLLWQKLINTSGVNNWISCQTLIRKLKESQPKPEVSKVSLRRAVLDVYLGKSVEGVIPDEADKMGLRFSKSKFYLPGSRRRIQRELNMELGLKSGKNSESIHIIDYSEYWLVYLGF